MEAACGRSLATQLDDFNARAVGLVVVLKLEKEKKNKNATLGNQGSENPADTVVGALCCHNYSETNGRKHNTTIKASCDGICEHKKKSHSI